MGGYIPNTEQEQKTMLEEIGYSKLEDLFLNIPEQVRLKEHLNLPKGYSELETMKQLKQISKKNIVFETVLRGAGAYRHYIPAIVKSVTSKEEFITAYTPYQAEISQGLLQSIFEYQTMICELTGMDTSNASVYDGATAAAESVAMCREKKRKTVLLSSALHPQVIEVIRTYSACTDLKIAIVPCKNGKTDLEVLNQMIDEETACVMIQQPNFYGVIEDAREIGVCTHEKDAKFIMHCNPIAMALLQTPGECGADIAVGEGQPLGMPLSFGGPYLGFMAATEKMMRKLPGRIVGQTKDIEGKRAFVLTLQAREQHIRREKAASNICSNQALCALTAAAYMSAMGPEGMKEAAILSMSKAHYLAEKLCKIPNFYMDNTNEFFHEFITTCPDSGFVLSSLEEQGILGGYPLDNKRILWCTTELITKAEMDRTVQILAEAKA